MALAITLRLDFTDEVGNDSFTKLRLPTGFAISDYAEFAAAGAQLLAEISGATIHRASLTFNVSLSGLGLSTVPNIVSAVARKAYLAFTTAVTGFFSKTLIPTYAEGLTSVGSDDIDTTDPDVAALVSAFEDGIAVTGGTLEMTNGRGHDITNLDVAKEVTRRRKIQ